MKQFYIKSIVIITICLNSIFIFAQTTKIDTTKKKYTNLLNYKTNLSEKHTFNKFNFDTVSNINTFNANLNKKLFDGYSIIIEGKVNLYVKRSFNNHNNFLNKTYFLKNAYQYTPKEIKKSSKKFIKTCVDYFSDCPQLIKKRKEKKRKEKKRN